MDLVHCLMLIIIINKYLMSCPQQINGEICIKIGPGSSVGIVTDYELDGPGLNPGRDEIFRLSRPALGPTQPPVQWVPGLSQG